MVKFDKEKDVLILVDFQNDFITGSLAVPNSEELVPVINKYISLFKFIIATRDYHPANHSSFVDEGGPWPPHCVKDTWGAKIHKDVDMSKHVFVVNKGEIQHKEEYSIFGNTFFNTLLDHIVSFSGDHNIFICGLATDYCVKATVMDAINKYKDRNNTYGKITIYLLTDAIAAVNIEPDDGKKAIDEMIEAGVKPLIFTEIE